MVDVLDVGSDGGVRPAGARRGGPSASSPGATQRAPGARPSASAASAAATLASLGAARPNISAPTLSMRRYTCAPHAKIRRLASAACSAYIGGVQDLHDAKTGTLTSLDGTAVAVCPASAQGTGRLRPTPCSLPQAPWEGAARGRGCARGAPAGLPAGRRTARRRLPPRRAPATLLHPIVNPLSSVTLAGASTGLCVLEPCGTQMARGPGTVREQRWPGRLQKMRPSMAAKGA
jgi:hypothetical protein